MVEHTSQVDSEVVMLDAFQRRAGELLGQEAVFTKEKGVIKVGLEVEYSLLDQNLRQVEESCRNRIVDENLEFLAPELGASQIELRTPPILLLENSGFRSVNATLVERQGCIETSAHEQGIQVLCSGTNPFIPLNEVVRSDKTKYQLVPNFHNDRRDGVVTCLGTEGLDIGDAAVVGLLNSVQANIEATKFYDAVDKLNRSFMISPMAVALTANARFLDLRDSSFNDVRMIAWERSHDTRNQIERELGIPTRVGLPARYCRDFADYLNCVSSYPFILDNPDHALEVGIGLFWRDARIKIIGNSAVVEFRPVSTQRSPELNTA